MANLVVQVCFPDSSTIERKFDQDIVLIGTGPDADLVVPNAPEVAPEHLLLMPRGMACWVAAARDAKLQPLLAGKPFENGLLPWGVEIDIGSISVRIHRPVAGTRLQHWQWPLIGVLAVGAAALAFGTGGEVVYPRTNAAPPALFDTPSGRCPEIHRAKAQAGEAIAAADAMETRYAYDPQQGINAFGKLAVAEACAATAGDVKGAADIRERRLNLQNRIDGDFKERRLALERALSQKEPSLILPAARGLHAYLTHRPGIFVDWLKELERQTLSQADTPKTP